MPSRPQYLLRFDDICPTMNWDVWRDIERLMVIRHVIPILSVVPDNRDPKLMVDPPSHDFWPRVREWQARGWGIGVHGHQHVYVNKSAGIMGITSQSEFAGLAREKQAEKLRAGLAIFEREGVRPDCWVAPSHSFDLTTVALLGQMGVRVISDGHWRWPHTDPSGVMWVPQQLWRLMRPRGPGVWTVCYHHNAWTSTDVRSFEENVDRYVSDITDLNVVRHRYRERRLSMGDRLGAKGRFVARSARSFAAKTLRPEA